jgi:phenylpropionate dioxygenase-like ring-hydroxylating dioxygenase large terminal subunit
MEQFMDSMKLDQALDERLKFGLKSSWYPVLPSWQLGTAPYGITRLNENIVLWRDDEGVAHALEDRCPHRGAKLSFGKTVGKSIACWYHGIEVNGAGLILRVPAMGEKKCSLVGRQAVRSYPVKEIAGVLFLWFGNTEALPPVELQLPAELFDKSMSQFLSVFTWSCNYQYAIDNLIDPMHGSYLHAVSHSMSKGEPHSTIVLSETETGMIVERDNREGLNFDWSEIGDTGTLWMRLDLPYGPASGPGGPFRIVEIITPMDDGHCIIFQWRLRRVHGWQRDAWRFLYRLRLEGLHWDVLEQDRAILESLPADARQRELLYQNDLGVVKARRLLLKKARDELEREVEYQARNAG